MRKITAALLMIFISQSLAFALTDKKVQPPKKIEHDGITLNYNPSWKDKEIYMEENLDLDPENEIIIGFVAGHKEEKETKEIEDSKDLFFKNLKEAKELPLIQNYAFYQIYDKKPNRYYEKIKTISGMDRLGSIEIIRLDPNEPPAIFILSPGGERYLELSIYQWKSGGYVLIFNKGTSGKIEYDSKQTPLTINIENKNEGWETFTWNTQKKVWQAQNIKL